MHHEPVMLNEVLDFIKNYPHSKIFDGTLGLGGYSEAFLKNFQNSFVFGIDRDIQAVNFSIERLKIFNERFSVCQKKFRSFE